MNFRRPRQHEVVAALFAALLLSCCACAKSSQPPQAELITSKEELNNKGAKKDATVADYVSGSAKPPTAEELQPKMEKAAQDWFYGPGVGHTMLTVGTIALFPLYAIYVAGNAGLTLAGYDPLYITDALPEGAKNGVNTVYEDVTSVPGRFNAAAAGVEFKKPDSSTTHQ